MVELVHGVLDNNHLLFLRIETLSKKQIITVSYNSVF